MKFLFHRENYSLKGEIKLKKIIMLLIVLCAVILTISGSVSAADIPSSSFNSTFTKVNAPLSVQFNDTSTGDPTSWYWNFCDGSNSTDQNTTHLLK